MDNMNNFTHNSKNANSKSTFVINKYNKEYIQNAKDNGCESFINSSELSCYYDFSGIKIIAITGTNGKTTTASTIGAILAKMGCDWALLGTNGFFVNQNDELKQIAPPTLTTPMQVDIYKNIQYAKEQNCSVFIMEISSHAIVQNRYEGLVFDIKICTNITSDHLDYHKSLQNYIDIKNSFLNDNSSLKPNGYLLINSDDKNIKVNDNSDNRYNSKVVCFATNGNNGYTISNNSTNQVLSGKISFNNQTYNYKSNFVGRFNLYNIIASVACVDLLFEYHLEQICNALEYVNSVSGRMEIVHKEPLVIVDFAHTQDGFLQVFESFEDIKSNSKIIAVFGAGGNRDKTKRAKMGEISDKYCDIIILTNDNPRDEDEMDIINDIKNAITQKCINSTLFIQPNRAKAISLGLSLAKKDDIVLVLGKGCEKYQIIKGEKIPFEDKKTIIQALSNQ